MANSKKTKNRIYQQFYELAGRLFPEDRLTYSSLSGIVRKKWVLKKLAQMPKGNLLDCGCNIGRLSERWKKGTVYAVDIAYSLVSKGKRLYPEINFIQGDIQNLNFIRTESIENAMAIEVVEHLEHPEDFLKTLYQALKKKGQALITTPGYSSHRPVLEPLGIIQSFGIKEGTREKKYLHTAYKPDELAEMAKRAGFDIIEKGSFEYELRGWVKPFTLARRLFFWLSAKFFESSKLNWLFIQFIQHLEIDLFGCLDVFGFSRLLKKIFKEGRRSYLLIQK